MTLAIPSNRLIQPQTAECALKLVAKGGHEFHCIVPSEGYSIAESRNYIAVKAVNAKSDYLMMVDDDMTFPADTLDTLLAVEKDIVGVAYHPRAETGEIIKYLDETHIVKLEQSEDPKYKVPFECHATGTGIILIKCSVFLKMTRPWFAFEYHETGQCKKGEDWYFCEKAKEFGIETWVEPRIKIGHWGDVTLT